MGRVAHRQGEHDQHPSGAKTSVAAVPVTPYAMSFYMNLKSDLHRMLTAIIDNVDFSSDEDEQLFDVLVTAYTLVSGEKMLTGEAAEKVIIQAFQKASGLESLESFDIPEWVYRERGVPKSLLTREAQRQAADNEQFLDYARSIPKKALGASTSRKQIATALRAAAAALEVRATESEFDKNDEYDESGECTACGIKYRGDDENIDGECLECAASDGFSASAVSAKKPKHSVEKVGDNWRIRTSEGKLWPQKYDTEKKADTGLSTYHSLRRGPPPPKKTS